MSMDWNELAAAISAATGTGFLLARTEPVSGGCIHQAHVLHAQDGRRVFVKSNRLAHRDAFACEAEGLKSIAGTGTIRVPTPLLEDAIGQDAFLVMEYIVFDRNPSDWALMGQQLAALHRHTAPTFGWHRDNWIGASPQLNHCQANWMDFFRDCRLAPQFKLAAANGLPLRDAQKLLHHLPHLLGEHAPAPSLIHGDLWAGNVAFSAGLPVLFDPAVHFADRECDLAMARLFGGFPEAFFEAYKASWPLPPGAAHRRPLYQLYHILNHANLFGGSYVHDANHLIQTLLC
jgi:protein-ribulosamine 3-kinase